MRIMYPGSPAFDGTYDDEHVIAKYEEVNTSPINDGGHTFGLVNLDYADAPDLSTVVTGPGGLPGTPYSPTPASPGPGMNPHNMPAYAGNRVVEVMESVMARHLHRIHHAMWLAKGSET